MSSVIRGRVQTEQDRREPIVIPVPQLQREISVPDTMEDAETSAEVIVSAAAKRADQLLEDATQEGKRLVEEAKAEAERLRVQAREEGLSAGRETGEAEYRELCHRQSEEHASRMEELTRLAEMIQRHREQVIKAAMKPLPEVAMEILRELLARELELAPANIEGLVQDIIQYVVDSARVEVRVNPSDYAIAQAAHPLWRGAKYGEWDLVVIPDQSVRQGGCQVRSDVGNIDASIDVKLEMLQEALEQAFAGGEVEQVGTVSDVTRMG